MFWYSFKTLLQSCTHFFSIQLSHKTILSTLSLSLSMFIHHSPKSSIWNIRYIRHDSNMLQVYISNIIFKEFSVPDNHSFLLNFKIWLPSSLIHLVFLIYGNCFSWMSIWYCIKELWVLLVDFTDWYIEISVPFSYQNNQFIILIPYEIWL